jgi:hypothetical protein
VSKKQAHRELELVSGELYPRMVELLGQQSADHLVENWRAMVVVCDSGEMRQGYCRGRKPGTPPGQEPAGNGFCLRSA